MFNFQSPRLKNNLLAMKLLGGMMAIIGIVSVILSTASNDCTFFDAMLNAGTELIGIGLTIGFVQWIFKSIQRNIDVESLTWDILFDTDYAIWVWQGGERVFNMEELLYLINKISPTDPFPATTQNIILALGNKASNLLKTKRELINKNVKLIEGFEELSNLSRLRDKGTVKPIQEITEIFQKTVKIFAEILDLKYEASSSEVFERDCSQSGQIWRHTGERLSPISGDPIELEKRIRYGEGVN